MSFNSRRRGLSQYVAALMLVAVGISGSVAVYGILNGYAGSTQSGPQITIESAQATQGTNVATVKVLLANTGNTPFTSLTLQVSGLESSSATFAGQASVVDIVTGSTLYTGTFTPSTPTTTITMSVSINQNQNVVIICSFQQIGSGASLFLAGNSYNLLTYTSPYAQAATLIVPGSA